ncbi:Oidioi.mRNA.OKI2018_I69.chr2.g5904.t1.cds [Oikopleura dioica]|uniref:Oidioi.mRNA.OKI2018_I69.chr2.g5904.t1.cds n=1 Tax=Oikopleura dioica TaxID=34765 RepID=A0ABN7T1E3_OIKDI|nr:Oidioi.mRNA.OKI2018_I69.chr2.g5904.t1.cds [Oikopleura dioica]
MNGNEELLALRDIYRERVIPENKRFKQRCVLFSAESLKENHRSFWKEIFLFNYSGGDRNRSTAQARDSEFDEFLDFKRFSDGSGPHTYLKKLLEYRKLPKEERWKKLKLADFAGALQKKTGEEEESPQTLSPFSTYIRPQTFLEEILDIQLHSLWLEKTTNELGELKLLFPNEKQFKEDVSKSDASVQEFARDEAKAQAWLNISTCLLKAFEDQAASVFHLYQDFFSDIEREMEDKEDYYGISAGTTNEFKLWLNEEVKKPDHLNPLSEENFTKNLSYQIPELGRLAATKVSPPTTTIQNAPYQTINHSVLKTIVPVLLKIRCFLEGKDELHEHLSSFILKTDDSNRFVSVTLADVFKEKISVEMNSKWLNSSLEEIEVRYVHEDFNPELFPLPEWLPDLKNLYTFLLATLARYPMTLCRHVMKKFESVGSNSFDHSNFIAEFNPVFDQCLKNEFKEALKCNFQKVLVPPRNHLKSGDFDLHLYLRRINNFSLYPIRAESIGRVLQFEMKHFKDLSRGMHISTKPKMIEFFQDNALVMMDVLNDWIKEGTIVKQHAFAEKSSNLSSLKGQMKQRSLSSR